MISELVMITAGINEKAGGTTDRTDPKAGCGCSIPTPRSMNRSRMVRGSTSVILAVTDPPGPLADIVRTSAGYDRVLSTGTLLDSPRLRAHLAEHFDVDANQVEAQAIGEQEVSRVLLWPSGRIAGVPIGALVEQRGETTGCTSESKTPFITPISRSSKANGSRQFGIGIVAARITECFAMSEPSFRSEVTKKILAKTLASPVVGRASVIRSFEPEMSGG
jgi:L-lactate dehydrogenase